MRFSTTSKLGKIQITDDGYLQQTCSFDKSKSWRVPLAAVTSIEVTYRLHLMDMLVYTAFSYRIVHTMPSAKLYDFLQFFPGIPVTEVKLLVPISRWYADPSQRTHIGVYADTQAAQRDMEAAYRHGWILQAQSTTGGQVSAAKIIAGEILLGPLGALAGATRSKDKITLTFVRSPEWLAAHPM
jgi:hypothetical protein